MVTLEVHHAIGKPPATPLSDYKWEAVPLGDGIESFADPDDPRIAQIADRLLGRPDILGVRVVVQPAAPATAPGAAVAAANAAQPGQVLRVFGQ